MPEDQPILGDPVWSIDMGNCIIIKIDEEDDTVLIEAISWGRGQLGDVQEHDLYALTSSWSERFGGLYMLDAFDITTGCVRMEHNKLTHGENHGFQEDTIT